MTNLDEHTASMEADAASALAALRAKGIKLPRTPEVQAAFMLGFCDGADWANRKIIKTLTESPRSAIDRR